MEGHLVGAIAASLTLFTLALIWARGARSADAFQWVLAAGAGMAAFVLGLLAGLHNCDQGTPIRLAVLFGGLTFVSYCFMSPKRLRLLWSVALFFVGISLCYNTANLYHRDLFTGNPKFSSGGYWHSFFTGVYERKPLSPLGMGERSMNSNTVVLADETGKIPEGSVPGMEKERKQSIGSANMEEDGTIILKLRAEGPKGLIGDALLRYPPGHPEYNNILRHLGGLKKGEVKQVPPWPPGNDQKK